MNPIATFQSTLCLTHAIAVEAHLTTFIRWVLQVTASGECSSDVAIALLDQAWSAQKLLWSLRDEQDFSQ